MNDTEIVRTMEASYVEPGESTKNVRNLEVFDKFTGNLDSEVEIHSGEGESQGDDELEHLTNDENTLGSEEIDDNLDYLEEVAFGRDMLAQQSLMENSMDLSSLYDSFGSYGDFKLKSQK